MKKLPLWTKFGDCNGLKMSHSPVCASSRLHALIPGRAVDKACGKDVYVRGGLRVCIVNCDFILFHFFSFLPFPFFVFFFKFGAH